MSTPVNMNFEQMMKTINQLRDEIQNNKEEQKRAKEEQEKINAELREGTGALQSEFISENTKKSLEMIKINARENIITKERNAAILEGLLHGGLGAGKIIIKVGGKETLFHIGKLISLVSVKVTGKQLAKTAAKIIPLVGFLMGVIAGGTRIVHTLVSSQNTKDGSNKTAQLCLGGAEIISGVCSLIPLVGVPISIGIDVVVGCIDVKLAINRYKKSAEIIKDQNTNENQNTEFRESRGLTIEHAYHSLDIMSSKEERETLNREDIDKHFRSMIKKIHPDHIENSKKILVSRFSSYTQQIIECRDLIYKERKWDLSGMEWNIIQVEDAIVVGDEELSS